MHFFGSTQIKLISGVFSDRPRIQIRVAAKLEHTLTHAANRNAPTS